MLLSLNTKTKPFTQKQNVQAKNNLQRVKEKGLSLIEASMVLALAAVVVAGVMFYYQSASDSNKLQSTNSELMSIMGAINGLYEGQSSFEGISNNILMTSSAITASMKAGSSTIKTPFGGTITLNAADVDGGKNNGYTLAMDNIPVSACVSLASTSYGNSLVALKVGTQDFNATKLPLKPSDAALACQGSNAKVTSITWTLQ